MQGQLKDYAQTLSIKDVMNVVNTSFTTKGDTTICKIKLVFHRVGMMESVYRKYYNRYNGNIVYFIGVSHCHPTDVKTERTGNNLAEHRAMVKVYAFKRAYLADACKDLQEAVLFCENNIKKINEKQNNQRVKILEIKTK